jgi:hypothetical protein
MFKNAAVAPNAIQSRSKATTVITLDLAFSRALDPQRLTGPKLSPPLARRVRNHRPRPGILARVSGLIPRVNTI